MRPAVAWRWLAALALARCALHLFANDAYGFHRDELALLDDARRLAWGYVAYPPLTPLLARMSLELFGESLVGFRVSAVVAQCLAMLFAGLITRELGGARMAQVVAALAVAFAPFAMIQGGMLQYAGIDYLWWVVAAWIMVRLANGADPRWWLLVGSVVGLGMLTRYTMLACVAGIVAGTLATPLRRQLATPWPWAGALVSVILFLPNAWWQWQHDFVYLDFVRAIHARDVLIGRTDGFLVGQLLVGANPFTAPLWLGGLAWLAWARAATQGRVLAWMYLVPLAVFLLSQARAYYLAPAYPMLLAAGAVAAEAAIGRLRKRGATAARSAVALLLLAAGVSTAALGLPLAPVGSAGWRLSRSVHDNFAEQVGWPELVARVAAIHRALPAAERARTAIFASNYGQAGAINLYGPRHGLPRAISTVNSYWALGPGDPPPRTVIVLGEDTTGVARLPATCTLAGRIPVIPGVDNEESRRPEIYLCRDFRVPITRLWPPRPAFG